MIFEKIKGCLFAYIFGKISPKNNIIKPITPTSIKVSRKTLLIDDK